MLSEQKLFLFIKNFHKIRVAFEAYRAIIRMRFGNLFFFFYGGCMKNFIIGLIMVVGLSLFANSSEAACCRPTPVRNVVHNTACVVHNLHHRLHNFVWQNRCCRPVVHRHCCPVVVRRNCCCK
jgi:hypothetical protein